MVRNRLLSSLAPESRDRLLSRSEFVELPVRNTLVEPDRETGHVCFLEAGLASVVAASRSGEERIEVGHIGFEGMTGFHLLLGVERTPTHTFMQVAGSGWQVPAEHLTEVAADDVALRTQLLRYVQTYQVQLAHSALANGRYSIPVRLARWLLMCHDRLGDDRMPLTHEFLALMLGVRRSGVTNEIHVLEGDHAIRATRGVIHIRDRAKLEAIAGDAYGVPEAEYAKLFGHPEATEHAASPDLRGKRILVAEDEYELAQEMREDLTARGASIVGPAPTVASALPLLSSTSELDAAVVDINLRGEPAFPLAEALRKRGVPFIFVSGYARSVVPSDFSDVQFYNKPIELDDLAAALKALG